MFYKVKSKIILVLLLSLFINNVCFATRIVTGQLGIDVPTNTNNFTVVKNPQQQNAIAELGGEKIL